MCAVRWVLVNGGVGPIFSIPQAQGTHMHKQTYVHVAEAAVGGAGRERQAGDLLRDYLRLFVSVALNLGLGGCG